jgi:hypothetical protein
VRQPQLSTLSSHNTSSLGTNIRQLRPNDWPEAGSVSKPDVLAEEQPPPHSDSIARSVRDRTLIRWSGTLVCGRTILMHRCLKVVSICHTCLTLYLTVPNFPQHSFPPPSLDQVTSRSAL